MEPKSTSLERVFNVNDTIQSLVSAVSQPDRSGAGSLDQCQFRAKPKSSGFDAVDVTVVCNGSELRKMVAEQQVLPC
jgi:hypothetical protein